MWPRAYPGSRSTARWWRCRWNERPATTRLRGAHRRLAARARAARGGSCGGVPGPRAADPAAPAGRALPRRRRAGPSRCAPVALGPPSAVAGGAASPPPGRRPAPTRRQAGSCLARRPRSAPPARKRNALIRDEQGATMSSITTRVGAATGALTLALAGNAAAHITANPGEAPTDSYATLRFDVGHGCEESPTTEVRIKVPPSVPSVTPAVNPFWDVATKEGKKDKVELHGETITRGVSEVIYTATQPLPPDRLDLLTMSVKLPAGGEGGGVYFPTLRSGEKGGNRWIQIPAEGERADELESPAPAV